MHHWGDGFPYFSDVESAAYEIGKFCKKWGRISVTQTKEKFGTARVYTSFGWYGLQSITHPGYVYTRYPLWVHSFDIFVIGKLFRLIQINRVVIPFQKVIYKLAYKRTIKKYPHIKEEIIDGADWEELL